ncbi:Neural proliferation differentiation control-1 [Trinorchestia longiramus]|nr:Neural proliferation differentiation control-1 [Trinorchestia longiramus]
MNKKQRAAKDTEYPAYGVTGPSRELSPGGAGVGGERNLAHSAHMYHYQQQKNQMIALDK